MPSEVKISWSSSLDIGSEHFPADKLNREKYAQFLTHFLEDKIRAKIRASHYKSGKIRG